MTPPPFGKRDANSVEDWDFIRKSWRATFLLGGPAVQGAEKQHYFDEMTRVFAAIVPNSRALMACDPEDDDNRLGFAVFAGPALHFVYVIQDFRRMGIAAALLDGIGIKQFTFKTIQGERRLKPYDRGWFFAPRFTLGT